MSVPPVPPGVIRVAEGILAGFLFTVGGLTAKKIYTTLFDRKAAEKKPAKSKGVSLVDEDGDL